MLRAAGLALLLAGAAPVLAQPAPRLPHRLVVPTLIISRNASVVEDLTSWQDLLQNDMTTMAGEGFPGLADAGRISFAARPLTTAPTLDALMARWRQENAIQVITAIGSRQGATTVLEGSVFLGDLAGGLATRSVPLPATIDAASYRASRDIVKASTLYALAVDAGDYRPAACPLLYRAGQARNDLVRRGVKLGGLGAAIDARIAQLKCQVTR
jgi:hypothetical protein